MTTLHAEAGESHTSCFKEDLTSDFCLRRPAILAMLRGRKDLRTIKLQTKLFLKVWWSKKVWHSSVLNQCECKVDNLSQTMVDGASSWASQSDSPFWIDICTDYVYLLNVAIQYKNEYTIKHSEKST